MYCTLRLRKSWGNKARCGVQQPKKNLEFASAKFCLTDLSIFFHAVSPDLRARNLFRLLAEPNVRSVQFPVYSACHVFRFDYVRIRTVLVCTYLLV